MHFPAGQYNHFYFPQGFFAKFVKFDTLEKDTKVAGPKTFPKLNMDVLTCLIPMFVDADCTIKDGMETPLYLPNEFIKLSPIPDGKTNDILRPSGSGWSIPAVFSTTPKINVQLSPDYKRQPIIVDKIVIYGNADVDTIAYKPNVESNFLLIGKKNTQVKSDIKSD